MPVVSVMNYKGGVGKTTIVANLGAELANRGHKVLMIDLDPQACLTFSFITEDEWKKADTESKTIRAWFDSIRDGRPVELSGLVLSPKRVADKLSGAGGLDLVASHLGLIDVDMQLATGLGGASLPAFTRKFLAVHGSLSDGLTGITPKPYDTVLIDTPPNLNIVTKTSIVASDLIVIPARPDFLSTLGIDYVHRNLRQFVHEYNMCVESAGTAGSQKICPEIAGVVFVMVQFFGGEPIKALRPFISQTKQLDVPVFDSYIRHSNTAFAGTPESGIPVVLGRGPDLIIKEIRDFVTEFEQKSNMGRRS